MNNGAFGENFPYSNFHDLNMDWIIKIAKDFLDQYTHIQDTITQGLEDLDEKATTLEALLQQWYDTHSEDIANQLAEALNDLNSWYDTHSEDIANQLAEALSDLNSWYTEHEGYLDQYVADSIASFNQQADQKAQQTIASIPEDYTELFNTTNDLKTALNDNVVVLPGTDGYIRYNTGDVVESTTYKATDFIEVIPGKKIHIKNSRRTGSVGSCFYYDNQSFLGTVEQESGTYETTVTIPNHAKYIRISYTTLPEISYVDLMSEIMDNSTAIDDCESGLAIALKQKTSDVDLYQFANSTSILGWEMGGIAKATGEETVSVNYIRSGGQFNFNDGILTIQQLDNYKLDVFVYDNNGNYLTFYSAPESLKVNNGLLYRFQCGNFGGVADRFLTTAFISKLAISFSGLKTPDGFIWFESMGTLPSPLAYTRVTAMHESICFIDETHILAGSNSESANIAYLTLYTFDNYNGQPTEIKQVAHTLGHMNTIDYQNGALIFGNGGSGNWNGGDQDNPDVGKFYIINNFVTKFNEHYQANTVLTLADAIEISCDYYNFTGCSKFNVLFGEVNIERYRNQMHDIAYIVCSTLGKNLYNTKIFRIQLGIGSNNLTYGTLQTVGESEYNGTYNVLDTYVGLSDGTDYPNDITFIDGNLYACVGENGVRYQKFILDNKTKRIIKHERKQTMYNPDGTVVGTTTKSRWSSGISCINDKVATTYSTTGGMLLFDKNSFK